MHRQQREQRASVCSRSANIIHLEQPRMKLCKRPRLKLAAGESPSQPLEGGETARSQNGGRRIQGKCEEQLKKV